jgi:hypothetical protein
MSTGLLLLPLLPLLLQLVQTGFGTASDDGDLLRHD